MTTLLLDVSQIISERGAHYGDPKANLGAIGSAWAVYLSQRGLTPPGAILTPADVATMMALLKLIRQATRPKADNLLDAAAYIELAARCQP